MDPERLEGLNRSLDLCHTAAVSTHPRDLGIHWNLVPINLPEEAIGAPTRWGIVLAMRRIEHIRLSGSGAPT